MTEHFEMDFKNIILYDNVQLGHNVIIFPFTVIGRPPMAPSGVTTQAYKKREIKPVTIGNNCVIGSNVVIYDDVKIGNNVLIGDGVRIREAVSIGDNVVVGMSCKIGTRTTIENNVKIMDLTNIASDALIEEYVFVAQGVMMGNDNKMGRAIDRFDKMPEWKGPVIKKYSRIGMNASILPFITIGEDSLVGAGAVVTKNIEPYSVVMGIPAKFIRYLREEERRWK